MANYQTPLSEEVVEVLNLTAGEKDCTIPSERGEINTNETKEVLKNLAAEVNALQRQVIGLKSCVILNEDEINLRECLLEMKELIGELKRTQSCSRNTNIQDSVTGTTEINKKPKDKSTNPNEVIKEIETVPTVSTFSVNNYLNNTEFPLPLFDENTVNPVFYLKQLCNSVMLINHRTVTVL
jgi:hypothetical protein